MLDSIKQLIESSLPKPEDYVSKLKAELDEILAPIVALSCGTEWVTLYDGVGLPAETKSVVLGPACVLMIVVQPRMNGKAADAFLSLGGYGRLSCGSLTASTSDKDVNGKVLSWLAQAEKEFETEQRIRREHKSCGNTRIRNGRVEVFEGTGGWRPQGESY